MTCRSGVNGIDITASNVTLHLNGHAISGSGTCDNSVGINVLGTPAPLTNVGILGPGTISNFTFNLVAQESADSFVNRVTVTSACLLYRAFLIGFTSSGWQLNHDVDASPANAGFSILLRGGGNTVVGCNVTDTIIIFSNNNVVVNNTAHDNSGGIAVFGSNNQIHANTTDNITGGASGIIVLAGGLGNNITGNKANGNLPYDLEDDNTNCGTNIWEGNKFVTANQSCIH